MIKKIMISIILSLIFISCDSKPKSEETGYKAVVNKEEYNNLLEKAEKYKNERNYKEAEKIFLELGKYDKKMYIRIADMYFESGEKSDKWYKLAYEKGNNEVAGILGNFAEEKKNYDEAEKFYREAIKDRKYVYYKNLGYMFENLNKTEEAIKVYVEGAEKKDADSIHSLIRIYYLKNDMKNVEYWKDKLLNDTEIIDFSYNVEKYVNYLFGTETERKIADLYFRAGQNIVNKNYKEAEKYKIEAIKYSKDEKVGLAGLYYIFIDEKKGKELFYEAYKEGIKNSIYYIGAIEYNEGNTEKAREYFKESAIKENNPEAQRGWADVLMEEGNYMEAKEWYIKSFNQKDALAGIGLLNYYIKSNQEDKKREVIQKLKTTKGLKNYTLKMKDFMEKQ